MNPPKGHRVSPIKANVTDGKASYADLFENSKTEKTSTPTKIDMDSACDDLLFGDLGDQRDFFRNPFKSSSKHRHESTEVIYIGSNETTSPFKVAKEKVAQGTMKVLSKVANFGHRLLTPFKKANRTHSDRQDDVNSPPDLKIGNVDLNKVPTTSRNGVCIADFVSMADKPIDVFVKLNDANNVKMSSPSSVVMGMESCVNTPKKRHAETSMPMKTSQNVQGTYGNGHVTSEEVTPLKSEKKSEWKSVTLACHSPAVTSKGVPGPSVVVENRTQPPQQRLIHLTSPTPLLKTPEKDDASCSPILTSLFSLPTKTDKKIDKVMTEKKGRNLFNILELPKKSVNGVVDKKSSLPTTPRTNAWESSASSLNSAPLKPLLFPLSEKKSDESPTSSSNQNDECNNGEFSEKQGEQLLKFLNNLGSVVKNPCSSIKGRQGFETLESTSQLSRPINTFKQTTSIGIQGSSSATETASTDTKSKKIKLGKHAQLLKIKKTGPRKPRTPETKLEKERDPLSYLQRSPLVSKHHSIKDILPILPKPDEFEQFDIYEEVPPRLPLPLSPLAVKSYPISILPPWVDPFPEKTAKRNLQKLLTTGEGDSWTNTTMTTSSSGPISDVDNTKSKGLLPEESVDTDDVGEK